MNSEKQAYSSQRQGCSGEVCVFGGSCMGVRVVVAVIGVLALAVGSQVGAAGASPVPGAVASPSASSGVESRKNPANYDWDNIQIVTSARPVKCGAPISVSRYDDRGKLLGDKVLANSSSWQLYPEDVSYTTSRKPVNFLFSAYNCRTNESRLYFWDLNSKQPPKLVISVQDPTIVMDAKFDIATDRILFITWYKLAQNWTVEAIDRTGRNRQVLLDRPGAETEINPTQIIPDRGRIFRVGGDVDGSNSAWEVVGLYLEKPFDETPVASGYGGFAGAASGSFGGLFDEGTIFLSENGSAYLCKGLQPGAVSSNPDCSVYRSPLKTDPFLSTVEWGFGRIAGAPSKSETISWFGTGEVVVQPAYLDSDGRPILGRGMNLKGGGASTVVASGVEAAHFDFALDALPYKTFILK
jgi:hypothetical protein